MPLFLYARYDERKEKDGAGRQPGRLHQRRNDHRHGRPVALKVNASIGTVDTKASGTQWSRYDQIGISTVDGTDTSYANVCYEWDGGSFTTPADNAIYFQSPETVAFHAYYPFTGEPGTAVQPLTGVSTDATNQTAGNQPLIDFLCASGATANSYKPKVNFTDDTDTDGKDCSFHHCMSQITLTFEAGDGWISSRSSL